MGNYDGNCVSAPGTGHQVQRKSAFLGIMDEFFYWTIKIDPFYTETRILLSVDLLRSILWVGARRSRSGFIYLSWMNGNGDMSGSGLNSAHCWFRLGYKRRIRYTILKNNAYSTESFLSFSFFPLTSSRRDDRMKCNLWQQLIIHQPLLTA